MAMGSNGYSLSHTSYFSSSSSSLPMSYSSSTSPSMRLLRSSTRLRDDDEVLDPVSRRFANRKLATNLGTETAKYNREQALQAIHDTFEADFDRNRRRCHTNYYNNDDNNNNSDNSDNDLRQRQRQELGDLYVDPSGFSGRTLETIAKLQEERPKKNYNWRKKLEEYENSPEFKKERTINSIQNKQKHRAEQAKMREEHNLSFVPVQRERSPFKTPATSSPSTVTTTTAATTTTTTTATSASKRSGRAVPVIKVDDSDVKTERTLGDKVVKDTEEEEEEKKKAASLHSSETIMALSTSDDVDAVLQLMPERKSNKSEEPEDVLDGTTRLKSEFASRMDDLDKEMESGKSKLARLRERIKRAKGAVKEADQAISSSKDK